MMKKVSVSKAIEVLKNGGKIERNARCQIVVKELVVEYKNYFKNGKYEFYNSVGYLTSEQYQKVLLTVNA